VRRSLIVGKQVLHIALGHDGGFARPGSGIKSDVPIKVQS
jgi:hypothetical protein